MMIWDKKERRKYPRKEGVIGVSIIEVNCKKLPYKFDHEIGKDISVGGVCIESTKKLSPSSLLGMELMLDKETPFIKAKGGVVWIKKYRRPPSIIEGIRIRERDNFIMGVEFFEIANEDREKIRKFVEKH